MSTTSRKTVTLSDVAALAGIGKATASRALNGKGYTSPQTREAVLKAAQELGFQPDLHAQRLRNGRSHNIVALFISIDLGVSTQQALFVQYRLDELGFEVEVHITPRYVSNYEEKQVALFNKVRRQKPGAIVFESNLSPQALAELRLFQEEGGVVVGYGLPEDLACDQVHLDLEGRAYLAAQHLLDLGHRDIGFCSHNRSSIGPFELLGFTRALEERGVAVREEWLFKGGSYEEGGSRLAEAFLSWSDRPSAICIINDVSASAFVDTLGRHGLSVPEDVSIVGFDDALAARYAQVPLTSVTYPLEVMGRSIVEFTQSRLKGYEGPPRKVLVHSELVVRNSTAPATSQGDAETTLPSPSISSST